MFRSTNSLGIRTIGHPAWVAAIAVCKWSLRRKFGSHFVYVHCVMSLQRNFCGNRYLNIFRYLALCWMTYLKTFWKTSFQFKIRYIDQKWKLFWDMVLYETRCNGMLIPLSMPSFFRSTRQVPTKHRNGLGQKEWLSSQSIELQQLRNDLDCAIN